LNVAVLTDLGCVTPTVIEHLKLCDAAFLETNYEHDMLMNGKYPSFLKKRVSSDYGHLSNDQAFDLIASLNGSPLKTVFLSHISADNNRVELAMDKFKPFQDKLQIEATSRHAISKVVTL
jgi:phosphoribosyl 1,2-cyclic phosphodiesterase